MSHLYLRGSSVWISFSDRSNSRRQKPTGFILEHINRRNGKIQWPAEIVHFKRRFDQKLIFGKWQLDGIAHSPIKLSELKAEFSAGYGHTKKPSTQYLYGLAIKILIDFIGDIDARKLTQDDIMDLRTKLLSKGSEANAAKILRSLGKVLRWAESRTLISESPVTQDHAIIPKTRPIRIFKDGELAQVFEKAKPAMRDQLRFLLLSGFRVGECCALTWEDVDFTSKVIRLWNEKESRWDYFPMDGMLEDFMAGLARAYEPYVFASRNRKGMSKYLAKLIKDLDLPKHLHVHTLRANFISNLVNAGLSESTLKFLARHRSTQTTHKYYTAFDQVEMRKALARSRA